MAGHRRGTGRGTRAERRAASRRRLLTDRLARAQSPVERLAAAADFARSVLADLPPADAGPLADELVAVLIQAAETRSR